MNRKHKLWVAVLLSSSMLCDSTMVAAQGTDTIKDNWDKVTSTEVSFAGEGGATLAGAIYLPPVPPRAAVVVIQGSDADKRMDGSRTSLQPRGSRH